MEFSSIAFLGGAVVALASIYFLIRRVREHHSAHVFGLWCVFSFSFVIASGLFAFIYVEVILYRASSLGGAPGSVILFIFNAALDVREEFYLISAIGAVLILPQLIAYCIAGIFGCARFPGVLVWIDEFIAWTLIKFFVVLGGILGAQAIFALYGHPYRVPAEIPSRLFYMGLFTALSFLIFFFITARETVISHVKQLRLSTWLGKVHAHMTRHAGHQEEADGSLDDAIFEYVEKRLVERLDNRMRKAEEAPR
ncbi:hypothetical protein PY650_26670 [Rhizobium calliandrae]|uniref:GGDEF domain-containing protein n=1 Tax=Rhizobium calliandrae TaxID=1312182 RepID=A0ABT7KKJ4_9HYPH|nr:hypothetical protein [Rhizobium calliandrae]MDL2409156.1 hypothetical protein [Rhizobium calliandrae]